MPDASAPHAVVLAIGSNHASADALASKALRLLGDYLTDLRATEALTTEAISIKSGPFRNCLATGHTTLGADELIAALKRCEHACGDRKSLRSRHVITMDIDLLLYDDRRYHTQDWSKSYIRELLPQAGIPLPPQT